MSQESCASTIPYELSQDQDQDFIDDLNDINDLYFQTYNVQDNNLLFRSNDSDSDINFDSDIEDDTHSDVSDHINQQSDSFIDPSLNDLKENNVQEKFKSESCGCKGFGQGHPCSTTIDFSLMVDFRMHCFELTKDELDLVIKSALYSHRESESKTTSSKHKITDRVRPSQQFFFRGRRVCRRTFCFLHGIDKQKLQVIGRSLDRDGLKPRVHGLKGKAPCNSLAMEERSYIVSFLKNYAEKNALPLPGRLPNFINAQVLLLPSDKRQADIHQIYVEASGKSNVRSASLSTFVRTWKDLCANIVLSKPSTDLCHQCQKSSFQISNSGSLDEVNKLELIDAYTMHVKLAKQERDTYREQCLVSKETVKNSPVSEGLLLHLTI